MGRRRRISEKSSGGVELVYGLGRRAVHRVDVLDEVDDAAAVAELVVVPGDELDEVVVE